MVMKIRDEGAPEGWVGLTNEDKEAAQICEQTVNVFIFCLKAVINPVLFTIFCPQLPPMI